MTVTNPPAALTPDRRRALLLGVFLFVASLFVLSAPGRIEFFDGQLRYEVARNLLHDGTPELRAPYLMRASITGAGGRRYATYSPGGSVAAMPQMALAAAFHDPTGRVERIAFSFTSAVFGGAFAAVFVALLLDLGVSVAASLFAAAVACFGTLLWPMAASVFDNAQHATLALTSLWLGQGAAARRSRRRALAAGLVGGLLLLYQEAFAVILPALGLATLAPPGASDDDRREGWRRFALFGAGAAFGAALWLGYNLLRFGKPFYSGKMDTGRTAHPPLQGNPLVGLAGLLASPGKSVFLYSPPLLLGLVGMRGLWRAAPRLGLAIAGSAALHLLLISCLSIWAGDWCWGPRYTLVVTGALMLGVPFVEPARLRRSVVAAVAVVGLLVQLMALSVDHTRFFAEQRLDNYFWARDPAFYFRRSALFARPAEMVSVFFEPLPREVRFFAPTPNPADVTLAPMRGWTAAEGPVKMRQFAFVHQPRPWPLWMHKTPAVLRPIDPTPLLAATLLAAGVGALLVYAAAGRRRAAEAEPPA